MYKIVIQLIITVWLIGMSNNAIAQYPDTASLHRDFTSTQSIQAKATAIEYDSINSRWLIITVDSTCRVFESSAANEWKLLGSPIQIFANNASFNFSTRAAYYFGANNYIESYEPASGSFVSTINDSIQTAEEIKSLALINNVPGFAVVRNETANYLFKKADNEWRVNPVNIVNISRLDPDLLVKNILWVSCLLLIGLIIYIIWRMRNINGEVRKYINSTKVDNALLTKSEKPIGLQSQDLLGFDELENAVLSIMKNPQTELPLSIVINGNWGSGKSSMMNRIKEKIETGTDTSDRFITTWFNVWHLQGESSLLNTFLLNVIEAYEKDYTFSFRLKLAVKRFLRLSSLKQLAFGFAIAITAPFLLLIILKLLPFLNFKGLGFIEAYCEAIKDILSGAIFKTDFSFQTLKPIAAIVFTAVSYFFLNKQFMPTGLSAFFELLPKNNFQFDVEKSTPGYREKFKKEYWEIVDAGKKDKRLVVFIDDIDRISGDKILELLEGINFISDIASRPAGSSADSPNTIFILGMYMSEVAKNLGAQLGKINATKDEVDIKASLLGSRYLEKMVQLIIPVPFDKTNKEINSLYENK